MGFYEKKFKVCPECQREMDYYENACSLCGHEFDVEYNDPRAPYIGENIGDYLYKFERLERKDTKIGWNWCAFLFGPTWMFYRKMYKKGLIFFAIPLIVEWILYLPHLTTDEINLVMSIVNLVISLGLGICAALYSDYWYMEKMNGLAREGASLDDEVRAVLAKDKGGASGKMVLVYLAMCVAAAFI